MQDKINLIPYRNVTLIFEWSRIIGVFSEGLNFIKHVSSEIKSEAIHKLKEYDYINEDLAEHLLNKAYRPVTISPEITSPSRIHLRKVARCIIVYKRETIIAIFQKNEVDFIDDICVSQGVYKTIINKLKDSHYLV